MDILNYEQPLLVEDGKEYKRLCVKISLDPLREGLDRIRTVFAQRACQEISNHFTHSLSYFLAFRSGRCLLAFCLTASRYFLASLLTAERWLPFGSPGCGALVGQLAIE